MSQKQELGVEWLLSLAAGTLSPAYRVVVESYLEQKEDCQKKLTAMETMGELLLGQTPAQPVSKDLRTSTLQQIEQEPIAMLEPEQDLLPPTLARFIGKPLTEVRWSFLGPGLQKSLLWKGGNDERLWLLKGKPETAIPAHTHLGPELNLVLSGGYQNNGVSFGPGDIEEGDGKDVHELQMDPDEDCICLAATQGPLRILNWPGRLLQPFLGI